MQHSQAQIEADAEAIAQHSCPETGRDLKNLGKEGIRSHIRQLFPHAGESQLSGSDYQRRFDALKAYFETRFKEAL